MSVQFRLVNALTPADVGARVVVRRALPEGGHTDVLGELVAYADGVLRVRTRDGALRAVPEDTVVAGKRVPPPPPRRSDVRVIHEASALHWRALESESLGGWLLRASEGFTGRANSVLPLDDPGRPFDQALDDVGRWYAARSLPPRFQLPLPLSGRLDAALADRGWASYEPCVLMTAQADAVTGGVTGLPPAVVTTALPDDWLAVYHSSRAEPPEVARRLLTSAPAQAFATVRDRGEVVAIGRVALGGGWAGITGMEVVEAARRRGLGGHVLAALCAWAAARGTTSVYLQVEVGNEPARALYARCGFTDHHRYHYRRPP